MRDWYAITWEDKYDEKHKKVSVLYYLELNDGGGILLDKFSDLRKKIGIDIGMDVLGYWCNIDEARKWVEEMIGKKTVVI